MKPMLAAVLLLIAASSPVRAQGAPPPVAVQAPAPVLPASLASVSGTAAAEPAATALPIRLVGNAAKLNLNVPLNTGAMLARDGANGMWRAGIYEDPLGLSYGAMPILEFGAAQSWTADHGYPGIGAHIGIPVGSLINAAQMAVTKYDLVKLWKPLGTASSWVRLNGGYQHLQQEPGAGGKKDIWYAGVDVNVPAEIVTQWLGLGI